MNCTLAPGGEIDALRRRCVELERQLEALQARQSSRLSVAADVHRSLLPKPIRHDRIWVDIRYQPVDDVGGDYCQVRFPDKNTCYITMSDVTGHGTASALLATRISSEVRYHIMYRQEPMEIVNAVQRFTTEQFAHTGLLLTFIAARIDLDTGQMTWSSAGHPGPFVQRAGDVSVVQLDTQNPLVGLDIALFNDAVQESITVSAGDRLFFFTDGLFEVEDADDRLLGMQGLAALAAATRERLLFEVGDDLLKQVDTFQHGPVTDDRTLIVAELQSFSHK
jgi:serine phosphatase RsbU (regulator of sigma subunit)